MPHRPLTPVFWSSEGAPVLDELTGAVLEKVGCWKAALGVYRLALFPFVSRLSVHSQDVSNPSQVPRAAARSYVHHDGGYPPKRGYPPVASLRVFVTVKRTG